MRKPYLLTALLWWGVLGFGTNAFAQSFTLNSNIPSTPLSVGISGTPSGPVTAPATLNPMAMVTGGLAPFTYQWSGGMFQPADDSSPTLTIPTGGSVETYTVTVTDSNGCVVMESFSVDVMVTVSEEIERQVTMLVFPNPNQGSFHISLEGEPFSDAFELTVLDQLGRQVFLEKLPRFTGSFEKDVVLPSISSGVYFLGLGSEDRVIYRKLIIE